jgi:hypothetical protein
LLRCDGESDDAAVGVADEVRSAAEAGPDLFGIVSDHCDFSHLAVAPTTATWAGPAALPVVRAVGSEDVIAGDSETEPVDHLGAGYASRMNQDSEGGIGGTSLMYLDGGRCVCGTHIRYLPLLSCGAVSRLIRSLLARHHDLHRRDVGLAITPAVIAAKIDAPPDLDRYHGGMNQVERRGSSRSLQRAPRPRQMTNPQDRHCALGRRRRGRSLVALVADERAAPIGSVIAVCKWRGLLLAGCGCSNSAGSRRRWPSVEV